MSLSLLPPPMNLFHDGSPFCAPSDSVVCVLTTYLPGRAIESRIMDKYRVNPDMAKGILTKFRSMSIGRSEEPLALYTLHEKVGFSACFLLSRNQPC